MCTRVHLHICFMDKYNYNNNNKKIFTHLYGCHNNNTNNVDKETKMVNHIHTYTHTYKNILLLLLFYAYCNFMSVWICLKLVLHCLHYVKF